jgi:hypothetical protein
LVLIESDYSRQLVETHFKFKIQEETMNHRVGRLIFAFAVGLLVAILAYRWITDPAPRAERALEESVVASARVSLMQSLSLGELEIVDALAPDRKVGKTYVFRDGAGWQVSGYYRRSEDDHWHAFLLSLSDSIEVEHLKIEDTDPELVARAANDARLEAVP